MITSSHPSGRVPPYNRIKISQNFYHSFDLPKLQLLSIVINSRSSGSHDVLLQRYCYMLVYCV